MVRKCPKCNDYSLDYDPDYKKWRCLWVDCHYEEDNDKDSNKIQLHDIIKS